jgi:FkbM family methyltransferase
MSLPLPELASVLDEIKNFHPPDVLAGSGPYLVYGAGGFGRDVLQALVKRGKTVLGFMDRGGAQEIDGWPCRHPDADMGDWLRQDPIVLMGLHNYQVNPLPIRDHLRALGFKRVHLPVEYHPFLAAELGLRYWLGQQDIYRHQTDSLKAVFDLLSDDKSRSLFLSTLKYRALGRPESQPIAEPDEAYFPTDIPRWSEPLHWVDGGACDGDSLRAFPLDRYRCASIHAFEPDLKNFAHLQHAIEKFRTQSPSTQLTSWPCGLGGKDAVLKFKTGLGLASAASTEGESSCPIVRLDSTLHGAPVNLIKLDIEGAEPDALLGAERIIQEQKPGLAICIYHTPAHLWKIPLQIAQHHPGYRFYLRCHGQSSFDLVLYAL